MTPHISTLSRRLLVAACITLLTAAVGIAQPKAEKSPDTVAPSQPSLAASNGVLVAAVEVGSPAEKAGIVRGDIILTINGVAVDTPRALRQALTGKNPGDTLTVTYRHGDPEKSATLTLGTLNGRPWVGLIISPPGFGMGMGDDRDFPMMALGAVVESVSAGGPADKAGMKEGDVIQSVDGTVLDSPNALSDLIAAKKVGDVVTLSILPGGQGPAKDVKVTLEKNPTRDAAYLGIQYSLNFARGFGRGMPGPAAVPGAFISAVATDGPAAKSGLQSGDIITKVAGIAVTNPQQVADAVAKQKPGDTLILTVYARAAAKESDVTVTLGQNPNDANKTYLGVTLSASMRGFGWPAPGGGMPRKAQPQLNGASQAPPSTL